LVWVIFWVWRLHTSCTALGDTVVCFSDDLGWILPLEPDGLKIVARAIALTLRVPIVVFVAGAAFLWARWGRRPRILLDVRRAAYLIPGWA
jgi:hypothetical protein